MFCYVAFVGLPEIDVCAKRVDYRGFCTVKTQYGESRQCRLGFNKINATTTCVHINGHPFLWAIRLILSSAPHLKVLEVSPSVAKSLKPSHHALCEERNVLILPRYCQSQSGWRYGQNRSSQYRGNREFFLSLTPEQKRLFDELVELRVRIALVARDYYCLDGGTFSSQHNVGVRYGYKEGRYISLRLSGLQSFLDPYFPVGRQARSIAANLKKKLDRLRSKRDQEHTLNEQRRAAEETYHRQVLGAGIEKAPSGLPADQIGRYKLVYQAYQQGTLAVLAQKSPSVYKTVMVHFGIQTGEYRSCAQVAHLLGGTRQNVWRRIVSGIAFIEGQMQPDK